MRLLQVSPCQNVIMTNVLKYIPIVYTCNVVLMRLHESAYVGPIARRFLIDKLNMKTSSLPPSGFLRHSRWEFWQFEVRLRLFVAIPILYIYHGNAQHIETGKPSNDVQPTKPTALIKPHSVELILAGYSLRSVVTENTELGSLDFFSLNSDTEKSFY